MKKQLLARGLIGEDDLSLYKITGNVDEAVREVTHFYSNFHSVRYSRDDLIIRLLRKPTEAQLEEIRKRFGDLTIRGNFKISAALAVERDEPALKDLHRLIFPFNRKDHGRLRQLIDYLNGLPA